MTTQFQAIDPVHLHRHWPFLLHGLREVQRKAHHRTSWWVEDVYAAIQNRMAVAYLVFTARATPPIGFFVVYPQQVPFCGETELFLWVVWNKPLRDWPDRAERTATALDTFRFLAQIAVQQGHQSVSTLTVRKGFLKAYAPFWRSEVIPCKITGDALRQLAAGA